LPAQDADSDVESDVGRHDRVLAEPYQGYLQISGKTLDLRDMPKSKSGLRRVSGALVEAAQAMWTHEVPRDAGAISYFSLFVLFPAILVLFHIVVVILKMWQLRNPVIKVIVELFPGSKGFLESNLMELADPSPLLFLAAFIVVIWGSTWIFTFLENALNRAWEVPRRRTFWESRIRNIALLLVGGTLLLASAGITLVVDAQKALAYRRVPAFAKDQLINAMWGWIILAAGFVIAITVFFCIYKLMPDCKVRSCEALYGAIVATILWEADWKIFAQLVPVFDSQKVYGTTGFIIALLTWVYGSSLITLYGANFSARLYRAERHIEGARQEILPAPDEVWEKNVRKFPRLKG
jgi:membrane protein